jgi:leucyl-tRNA synthetase
MHLLYTRFFTKALRDLGMVDFDEPMLRLFNQGMILGPDGEKMSKSRGNVINPDELSTKYGADTVRGYLMFIGPWDHGRAVGHERHRGRPSLPAPRLGRRHRRCAMVRPVLDPNPARPGAGTRAERKLHQTIIKVTDDMAELPLQHRDRCADGAEQHADQGQRDHGVQFADLEQAIRSLQMMMAPIFPHIAEELWHRQGNTSSVHLQRWPEGDPEKAREEEITVVVQINGKVRDKLVVAPGVDGAALEGAALALERASKSGWTANQCAA